MKYYKGDKIMQEKYHVIDNDERYYVIIKCTK